MKSGIGSMTLTMNCEAMFISDLNGYVKQINLESEEILVDYGKIHLRSVLQMCVSSCNRFLYTSDIRGNLKVFSTENGEVVKDFGKVHQGQIWAMSLTI